MPTTATAEPLSRYDRTRAFFADRELQRDLRNMLSHSIPHLVHINRLVLQCRLFSIATLRPTDLVFDDAAQRMYVNTRFEAGYAKDPVVVEYDGILLTQDHRVVLQGLLEAAAGQPSTAWIEIHPRRFAEEKLGWKANAYSAKKIKRALLDMQKASLCAPWGDEHTPEWISLIHRVEFKSKTVRVQFHASIVQLFRGNETTALPPSQLRRLKSGVETWLWAFVRSSDCKRVFATAWFYRMSGAAICKSEEEFSRDLGAALEKLKKMRVIKDYTRARGEVRIQKK